MKGWLDRIAPVSVCEYSLHDARPINKQQRTNQGMIRGVCSGYAWDDSDVENVVEVGSRFRERLQRPTREGKGG